MMSTRCQITVEGQPVKLYKHSDGYEDGVLPTLLPFIKDFVKNRGWDPEYMMARMTGAFLANDAKEYEEHDYTGFGLDTEWHGDLAYKYIVHKEGDIEIVRIKFKDEYIKLVSWKD